MIYLIEFDGILGEYRKLSRLLKTAALLKRQGIQYRIYIKREPFLFMEQAGAR